MSLLALYLLLLKATLSSFSGLASLPILRDDFVVHRTLLTDRQLNTALVIGRTTPGPKGLYVVSLGYYIAGYPGAVMAWAALATPALLVVAMLGVASRFTGDARVKRMLRAVVIASAGVSLSATLPLGVDALTTPLGWILAAAALVILLRTEWDTLWVMAGAALVSLGASLLPLAAR
ncbi:MAG: chromate transporter [Acidobacteria bacterium]|nr:chromate transporter [Acidobacteriota bacterium]